MGADAAVAAVERPAQAGVNAPAFGSDVVADTLRALDIPYIALTPGASYRGLHDSLVNYLGNSAPQMLLCLHEESAIAIAHGYAKVTGKAMSMTMSAGRSPNPMRMPKPRCRKNSSSSLPLVTIQTPWRMVAAFAITGR